MAYLWLRQGALELVEQHRVIGCQIPAAFWWIRVVVLFGRFLLENPIRVWNKETIGIPLDLSGKILMAIFWPFMEIQAVLRCFTFFVPMTSLQGCRHDDRG